MDASVGVRVAIFIAAMAFFIGMFFGVGFLELKEEMEENGGDVWDALFDKNEKE